MSEKIHRQLIIPNDYKNQRLDQALSKLLPDISRTQIKEWIEKGEILVNNKTVKPKLKVFGDETVDIHAETKAQPEWQPQSIPLSIVHEDDDIIIINKPIGLVVHPGAGNQDKTLLNALLFHCPASKDLPRAGILHRLDKNTSGLLIVAKNNHALTFLSRQLKKRQIVREYQAVVYGDMISGGTISAPIDRHPIHRKQMAVIDTGKPAITHYRVLEKYRSHTRLIVRLETGRTHQIRVHLSYIHHPIVGDVLYGGRVRLSKGMTQPLIDELRRFNRQALHAFAIGFTHPTTQEFMRFEIGLPDDIINLVNTLKADKTTLKK